MNIKTKLKNTRDIKRRDVGDRRCNEKGPPVGHRDRRRTVERRLPIVEEGITEAEWFRLMTIYKTKRQSEERICFEIL